MAKWEGGALPDYAAIRESVSILEVIDPFVEIPSQRPVFYTKCPIHKGDSPTAFKVDVDTNGWFCFRCDKGGSVLDFVMAIMNISLREAGEILSDGRELQRPDAVQKLAQHTGHRLKAWQARNEEPPPLGDEDVPETNGLDTCRGLSSDAISHFGLRRIPGEGWGTGTYIPFRDQNGVRIGYAIRHPEGVKPKYLNSKGMARGSALYGFWENRDAIAVADTAIIVEGQFDCMSLWDRGLTNVCALMGKQLTQKQATILMPYCHRLKLLLDGDEEGQKAMQKIVKDWHLVFDIEVISITGDPDEIPTEELKEKLGVAV